MKSRHAPYHRPSSLEEAVELLSSSENGVILAGGQSLVAALNLRLNAPDAIIDINFIPGLGRITETDEEVVIGAIVRHNETAASSVVSKHLPLIHEAMAHVAHPAIRNRGTTCGSIAHADPAAEMPACAVLLDAKIVLKNRERSREVAARDFFFGIYETERQPNEMLIEIRFPKMRTNAIVGFGEVARRHGDFASVGLAGIARMSDKKIQALDMVAFASEPAPLLCRKLGQQAINQEWSLDLIDHLSDTLAEEINPSDSPLGTPEIKRRQARALARRVLARMMEDFHAQ